MPTHVQPILATVLLSIALSDSSYPDFPLRPSPVTHIDWQLLLDFVLSPSYFISDDCSSLGHQLRPPLSYSGSTNPCLVWTFEFPPSCPFVGLGNSLADLEVFVYTLLPWPDTSSAACTYLCLSLAAWTLINFGLLVFRLVVPSLDSVILCSTWKLCPHSAAILWHCVCCLCLPLAFFCLSKTFGYSGLLNFQLSIPSLASETLSFIQKSLSTLCSHL